MDEFLTICTLTPDPEAHGRRTTETGTNADKQRGNSKDEDPTGLLNEGFRYRDLETGVWLSRDPAGFVDGPNVYAYVRQNPWSRFDPLGLSEEVVGDVYDLANDEKHYQGMTLSSSNTSGGAHEDAQNRLNRGGTTGHPKAHEILEGKNPTGGAYQVTVPEGSNLSQKQSRELMEAVESRFMHDQADARKGMTQLNDSARFTREQAEEIISKYKATVGERRPYQAIEAANSIGKKWAPEIPLGSLSRFGKRISYAKYFFASAAAASIGSKIQAGEYGSAVYEGAGFLPGVGEAQLAGEGVVMYGKGAHLFYDTMLNPEPVKRMRGSGDHVGEWKFWRNVFGVPTF